MAPKERIVPRAAFKDGQPMRARPRWRECGVTSGLSWQSGTKAEHARAVGRGTEPFGVPRARRALKAGLDTWEIIQQLRLVDTSESGFTSKHRRKFRGTTEARMK